MSRKGRAKGPFGNSQQNNSQKSQAERIEDLKQAQKEFMIHW